MFILIEAKVGSGRVGVTDHGNQNEEIPIDTDYINQNKEIYFTNHGSTMMAETNKLSYGKNPKRK
jgi:hypothetical protein